jgi:EAL domain-containing protein (putative c-di-GMP-specific phosphodiesterase class I)
MRDADIAMYEAKQCGKDRFEWYRPELGEEAIERFELRADLTRALERGEFRLHYQPIVRIENAEVRAIEALVRWEHPTKGLVPPVRFISIAEETGAIVELGEWILREACRQAVALTDRPDGPRVAVNLSAVQLQTPGLVDTVRDTLRQTGLTPRRLAFELTESAMIEDYAAAARTLTELRSLGIIISLDDFGTGYTSLRQIQAFPLDVVKLAATFTDMSIDADLSVLASVVTMASQLGLVAIGEGIERPDQVERLRAAGCKYAQGYLFSRPVPGDEIADVIARIEAAGPRLGIGALTAPIS